MDKKETIDKIITDNIKFHPSGNLKQRSMNDNLRIVILSLTNKYSYVSLLYTP